MEVTAFHRNLIRSSLWPYSSRHRGWPLAITIPYGVRTFLPLNKEAAIAQLTLRMQSNAVRANWLVKLVGRDLKQRPGDGFART